MADEIDINRVYEFLFDCYLKHLALEFISNEIKENLNKAQEKDINKEFNNKKENSEVQKNIEKIKKILVN